MRGGAAALRAVRDEGAPLASERLPAPVERFAHTAFGRHGSAIETLVMEGRGRVRIGRLPWMPINIWMHHRLGRDYVGLIRVRPAGLTVLSVIDAYVDGAGITKIGPAASIGPEVDQGAFLGMWAAAVAYPSTWSGGVRWRAVDERSARVRLPFGNGSEEARIDFDPQLGFPVRFEADRYRTVGGPKLRWYGDSSDWRSWDGIPAPRRVTAWWSDQPTPWFEMSVESVRANVDVDQMIDIGRQAIADARRRHEVRRR
jgi:hypothetical protein